MPKTPSISECMERHLAQYFRDLEGQDAVNVYHMVLMQVEKPMLVYVMERCEGNQSKAAEILGLNRNNLRKKLILQDLLI